MVDPLDLVPETLRKRLYDYALTRAADLAENNGAGKISVILRDLRNETPFREDIESALAAALIRFEAEWAEKEPEVVSAIIGSAPLWSSDDFYPSLQVILLTPGSANEDERKSLRRLAKNVLPAQVSDDQISAVIEGLIKAIRDELWTHDKLREIHDSYMQRLQAETQLRLLEEFRGFREDHRGLTAAVLSKGLPDYPRLEPPSPTVLESTHAGGAVPEDPRSGGVASENGHATDRPRRVRNPPSRLPDVLTPSLDGKSDLIVAYESILGPEIAAWLSQVQQRVLASIEEADFRIQEEIGSELLSAEFGVLQLDVAGHYLQGEARRLMADFEKDPDIRARLLRDAVESYGTALDLAPGETRAMRGLARTLEVQGETGSALEYFRRARAAALYDLSQGGTNPPNDVAHEVMRATRHYTSCIVDAMNHGARSEWNRQDRQVQLHGFVAESDELHRAIMPRFSATSRWMSIEWFMGLVLLAKAYARVGDDERAWSSLLHALSARFDLMNPSSQSLTEVERANLSWWCRTASALHHPPKGFHEMVDMLSATVAGADASRTIDCMRELLVPITPPWQRKS